MKMTKTNLTRRGDLSRGIKSAHFCSLIPILWFPRAWRISNIKECWMPDIKLSLAIVKAIYTPTSLFYIKSHGYWSLPDKLRWAVNHSWSSVWGLPYYSWPLELNEGVHVLSSQTTNFKSHSLVARNQSYSTLSKILSCFSCPPVHDGNKKRRRGSKFGGCLKCCFLYFPSPGEACWIGVKT